MFTLNCFLLDGRIYACLDPAALCDILYNTSSSHTQLEFIDWFPTRKILMLEEDFDNIYVSDHARHHHQLYQHESHCHHFVQSINRAATKIQLLWRGNLQHRCHSQSVHRTTNGTSTPLHTSFPQENLGQLIEVFGSQLRVVSSLTSQTCWYMYETTTYLYLQLTVMVNISWFLGRNHGKGFFQAIGRGEGD